MSTATLPKLLTVADLLAIPDEDGVERWLVDGELREKYVTKRNRFHSKIMATLCQLLKNWLDVQPSPRGDILCGEAGVILGHDPDSTAGIDVVYVSAELVAAQSDETTLVDGIPTLVVEILSPHDTQKEIDEKIDRYLAAGVPHIWTIDPHDKTVLVHQPKSLPRLFTTDDEITAEPQMPGMRLDVSRIFE